MSFLGQEQGLDTASPLELYEVRYDSAAWYYVSGDAPFTDPVTLRSYTPLNIRRGEINASNDYGRAALEVQVERGAPFLDLFRIAPPSSVVGLTIRRVHRTDTAKQIAVIWKGRILSLSFEPGVARLHCESVRASIQRYGLRRKFQYQCPHQLFGPACGVSKSAYEVTANVTDINGVTVTCSSLVAYANNYFAGGYIEWLNNSLAANERRTILSSSNLLGEIVLMTQPVGLSVGQQIRLYPGCEHNLGPNGCPKYNNEPNYGGMPHTPINGPFDGGPLF